MRYTIKEKIADLKRELRRREREFREMVNKGQMRPDVAQERIDILRDIIADYEESVQPALFEEVG